MDSLTQIAVGMATVEAVAGKSLRNKGLLLGALLGTLPDLDVWVGKLFPYAQEVAFHRSFTHSLLGIMLISIVIAFLLQRIWPALTFKRWAIVVGATLTTHIGIDLFTSWGVQLLYPLPDRYSLKTIFVVDVFYTIPWLVTLLAIFRNSDWSVRRRWLQWGFGISSVYLFLTVVVKLWVVQQVNDSLKQEGITPEAVIVKPTFSNIILWNINLKTPEAFFLGDYSLLDTKSITYKRYERNLGLEQQFAQDASVKRLAEASEQWYTITPYTGDSYAFNDLRFGVIEKENAPDQFVFAYQLQPTVNGVEVQPLPKTLRDGKATIKRMWRRLQGN